jgi:dihydrofolate reductase
MRVVLIAAQSLDGFITRHRDAGTAFTSPEDKAWFPACLRDFDCCVMGGATYREARVDILQQLEYSTRQRFVMTRSPAARSADTRPGKLEFTDERPQSLCKRLGAKGLQNCALLGGGEINGLFLAAGLVDEVWLTIEPRLFGEGRPLANGRLDVRLRLNESIQLGPDVWLLKYSVDRGATAAL